MAKAGPLSFERREITVRRGKGQKDRRVMLPDASRKALEGHLERVRRLHHADLAAGFGRVVLSESGATTILLEPSRPPSCAIMSLWRAAQEPVKKYDV